MNHNATSSVSWASNATVFYTKITSVYATAIFTSVATTGEIVGKVLVDALVHTFANFNSAILNYRKLPFHPPLMNG